MFNSNSGLVKVWVNLIKSNQRTIEEIPTLQNLKEVVIAELNK